MSPAKKVRPTAEIVRVAWLDALGSAIEGARVLDLFAGSGALGLEALSRGAKSVDFVENGSGSLHALKANVAALRATKCTRIFKRDVIPFVARLKEGDYDIVMADPPYGSKKLDRVLESWKLVPFGSLMSCEHASVHELPLKGRTVVKGDTSVTFFENRADP